MKRRNANPLMGGLVAVLLPRAVVRAQGLPPADTPDKLLRTYPAGSEFITNLGPYLARTFVDFTTGTTFFLA